MFYRNDHDPTIGSLIKDLADDTRLLLRQEMELARAEFSESISKIIRNVIYLAVGGLVLYAGFLALLAASSFGLVAALNNVMEPQHALWLGPLIVGLVVAIVGYVFVQKAITTLKNEDFKPHETIDSLRENKEWLQDRMTHSASTPNDEERMYAGTTGSRR